MTCSEYRDHVEDVLDGLLPPEEAARLDAHREHCDDCVAQWDEAVRFRDLLARDGRAALGAWEARRLAVRAATLVPDDAPETAPPGAGSAAGRRFTMLRLAAAAAIVAAAGFVGSGLLGEPGPVQLAYGAEARLEPGTEATFGHDCRLVVEDRAATLTLRQRPEGGDTTADMLDMERGVALFRVHPEHALGVATPQGVARAVGATFVVDVRSDGAVSVDVVTGRVRLERADGVLVARPGERVEIDSGGATHIVSRARLDELELESDRHSEELDGLRTELSRVERQLDDYIRIGGSTSEDASADDELPFDELGRALRTMIDRSVPWRDERRDRAMALYFLNAERLRAEFGVSDPMRALETPRLLAAVADGFLAALAPGASEADVAAAAAALREACGRVEAETGRDALPTELATAHQRALVDVIRAVERHLGVAAAAEVVRSFRGAWDGPRPMVQTLDDRFEAKMVGFWQKSLGLDDEQTNRVAELIRAYVAQALVMQQRVAATLPADEVDAVLYPRPMWGPGSFPSRPRTDAADSAGNAREPGHDEHDEDGERAGRWGRGGSAWPWGGAEQPGRADSEVVSERLREIDARLHLAEPRSRFERALANLLSPEQREKAFRRGAQLLTFREQ